MTLGIVLLKGARRGVFLMSEVTMYGGPSAASWEPKAQARSRDRGEAFG
jgi:hypothetical protein